MGDKPEASKASSLSESRTTTNLYVHNLAPDLTEDILRREFGRFGTVASVKVMWPRDDDPVKRSSNVGFVAFMDRSSAARCIDNLNGEVLHGHELRIGWGKSVPLPQSFSNDALLPLPPPLPQQPIPKQSNEIHVAIPNDLHLRFIIDSLAAFVSKDGSKFEKIVREREVKNPTFAFLFDPGCEADVYYRWRLFTLMQGDSMQRWRLEPFVMIEGGPVWKPPNMCTGDGSRLTAAQRGEGTTKRKLMSDIERRRLETMLAELDADKSKICDAMVFALKNAEAAEEVVDILVASLSRHGTSVSAKVARLFLVSDILHNSSASVRNASQYRSRLQEKLPDVFESFQETYASLSEDKSIQDSLKKYKSDSKQCFCSLEQWRQYILRVLRVWRNWYIFSNDYLNGLQSTFLAAQISEDAVQNRLKTMDVEKSEDVERKCRFNGLSLKGGLQFQRFRLARLDVYLQGEQDSTVKKSKPKMKRQPSVPKTIKRHVSLHKKQPEAKTSGWISIDEKQSTVPVSQWIRKQDQQTPSSGRQETKAVKSEALKDGQKNIPVKEAGKKLEAKEVKSRSVTDRPISGKPKRTIEDPDFDMFQADDDDMDIDPMPSIADKDKIKKQKTNEAA